MFPGIGAQIKEKKKIRQVYEDLKMNQYLERSDSDFDDYASVSS